MTVRTARAYARWRMARQGRVRADPARGNAAALRGERGKGSLGDHMRGSIIMGIIAAVALVAMPASAQRNRRGTQATELDPTGRGAIFGVGLESRDIDMMADQVMRELMSRPDIVGTPTPPRVVIDSEKFYNDSSQRIDRDMLTGSLRASLSRAAAGRIRFVSRESMDIVMRERELKRTGVADGGTRGMTQGVSGVDYQLIGKMSSLDSRDTKSGLVQRRTQVVFELVDLETGDLPWTSQPYVILRAAGDDIVYR
ncbi:penicillin-binding protein activator LpoB [Sphingomonas sp. Leaf4]|uniref:penicillin-binding protein activator LpoB n=1 Tax=Sphingomonas sp. Leaf4 TaxID=2876553 RepID=UPI001E4377B2|nr:penicillin-binding protein activator LpoB [Sphingomonas sp. Leaf4]